MDTNFTIKNFRVFDENGVTIDIKPLTILTGCNSSGKSSIVKAAFLLNDFMRQVNKSIKSQYIQLDKFKLDFTTYPNNLLGRFDKVIPEGSSCKKITFGYTIFSCLLFKDVDVQFEFVKDENDDLNNAYLDSITFSTDEGVFYYSGKERGNYFNLNVISKYLPTFANIDYLVRELDSLNCLSALSAEEGGVSEDELERRENELNLQLQKYGRAEFLGVVKYNLFKKIGLDYTNDEIDILDWTQKNDSYFNIPVLDYLRTIKKEHLKSIIEKELIPEDDNNTYQSSPSMVLSASNKVVAAFLVSSFDYFDEFFKDFEHRYFENLVCEIGVLCLSSIRIKQDYFKKHPESRCQEAEVELWNDERMRELEREREIESYKPFHQKIKEWEEEPLTFEILYQVVMLWNEKYAPGKSTFYDGGQNIVHDIHGTVMMPGNFHHKAFEMLCNFANKLVFEALSESGFENMSYVSSSRASVKKMYALEEKNDFTELLKFRK